MKIAYCSDLHLEFGPLEIKNTENADILILAGDICVDSTSFEHAYTRDFFEGINGEFPLIFYVLGNHEHYNGNIRYTFDNLTKRLQHLSNIKVVNNYLHQEGVLKIALTTMWTDLETNPLAYINVRNGMKDFKRIFGLTRLRWWKEYNVASEFLDNTIDNKTIVVTHHAPCIRSIPVKYRDSSTVFGYYSDKVKLILDRQPIVWIHGHTHNINNYTIGNTRVLSNPRGYYGYEAMSDYFSLKYYETSL